MADDPKPNQPSPNVGASSPNAAPAAPVQNSSGPTGPAPGNESDRPKDAPQSPMTTQPSQTLNPEPPPKVVKVPGGDDLVRVTVTNGKHKYQERNEDGTLTGEWKVAQPGDTILVTRRVSDRFADKFKLA